MQDPLDAYKTKLSIGKRDVCETSSASVWESAERPTYRLMSFPSPNSGNGGCRVRPTSRRSRPRNGDRYESAIAIVRR
jgi:hypothetical protein